jgi:hypothetical protein
MNEKSEFERLCLGGDAAGPASAVAIEQAEKQLGVRFPQEYRDFLLRFGALMARGVQIYGIIEGKNDPPLWESVVTVTQRLRGVGQAGTERTTFVAISHDGFATYFFLGTSASPQAKIWAIGPGVAKIVSSSLSDFAVDQSQDRLAY